MTQLSWLPITELRNKHHLDVFIETGTGGGDGIVTAIGAGFTECYSCDVNPKCLEVALGKTSAKGWNKYVNYYLSESPDFLRDVLKKIHSKRVMFWLDAHLSEDCKGKVFSYAIPLEDELKTILDNRYVGNDVIIIDDAVLFDEGLRHPKFDIKKYVDQPELLINREKIIELLPNHNFLILDIAEKVFLFTPKET